MNNNIYLNKEFILFIVLNFFIGNGFEKMLMPILFLITSTLIVKWKITDITTSKYLMKTRQKNIGGPSNDGFEIYNNARKILQEHLPNKPVRLLGLICIGLSSHPPKQINIFNNQYYSRRNDLNQVLDKITYKFGSDAIGKFDYPKKKD